MTEPDIDRRDVVDEFWPYDGPHSRETVIDAANAIPDLVRYLNNATQPGTAARTLAWANTIDALVSAIKTSVYRMDQLIDQLAAAARTQAADPSVYDARATTAAERHNEGAQQARELADKLNELRPLLVTWEGFRAVGGLAKELEEVHSISARLANDPAEEEDED